MKVAIIMGSKSDLPIVMKAQAVLEEFEVECETRVMSAHRTPKAVIEFAENAEKNGIAVIIAAAGKAAHLAGFLAANTVLPIIGLPIKSSTLDGLDSLLSTVQMPKGIPVATVAIDGAENAALLAIQMLALSDSELKSKLTAHRVEMSKTIAADDSSIQAK